MKKKKKYRFPGPTPDLLSQKLGGGGQWSQCALDHKSHSGDICTTGTGYGSGLLRDPMLIPESLLLNTGQSTTGWGPEVVFKDVPQLLPKHENV